MGRHNFVLEFVEHLMISTTSIKMGGYRILFLSGNIFNIENTVSFSEIFYRANLFFSLISWKGHSMAPHIHLGLISWFFFQKCSRKIPGRESCLQPLTNAPLKRTTVTRRQCAQTRLQALPATVPLDSLTFLPILSTNPADYAPSVRFLVFFAMNNIIFYIEEFVTLFRSKLSGLRLNVNEKRNSYVFSFPLKHEPFSTGQTHIPTDPGKGNFLEKIWYSFFWRLFGLFLFSFHFFLFFHFLSLYSHFFSPSLPLSLSFCVFLTSYLASPNNLFAIPFIPIQRIGGAGMWKNIHLIGERKSKWIKERCSLKCSFLYLTLFLFQCILENSLEIYLFFSLYISFFFSGVCWTLLVLTLIMIKKQMRSMFGLLQPEGRRGWDYESGLKKFQRI